MHVIERVEFELAYLEIEVQHFNYYATEIPWLRRLPNANR